MTVLPGQTELLPVMADGWVGTVFAVTVRLWLVDDPQLLLAVTVMVPLLLPAEVVMLVLALLPDQPEGSVQV